MDFSIFSTKVCEKNISVPGVSVWHHNGAVSRETLSSGFPARSNTNHAVKA